MRIPIIAAAIAAAGAAAVAGTELVSYPAGFETDFVRYAVVDRPDRGIARFMYMNRPAWEAATRGAPLPDGAVLVMEDHRVRLKGEAPVLDAWDRMIPSDETTNVFVMEKRAGWGADYPEETRNGEWEYAWFDAKGVRSEKTMEGCFACHKAQATEDFTFTAYEAIARRSR